MDHSKVHEWVEANKDRIIAEYGLSEWEIDCECNEDMDARGRVNTHVMAEYRARIQIKPSYITDEANLEDVYRHEVEHIMLAPFEIAMRDLSEVIDENVAHLATKTFRSAAEQARWNIRRMYKNLTRGRQRDLPQRFAETGK